MTATATITSKRQLTIPVSIFNRMNLTVGDVVVFIQDTNSGGVEIHKAVDLVDRLAGSVQVNRPVGDIDADIAAAKYEYFSKKNKAAV
ncbi:MAG: AbrB/MazE/SpoVT family DNA-binding domain-containing protein [Pseudomonadales bacterium]|nr:AbrB/MazE/SpoVT family DNA-binding domain-containing protein [Pseudomonadales bacterium]